MLQSPAKRRKTSETNSVSATEQNINPRVRSTPTTPSRASYLSPTKASLARSHPHLIGQNYGRSLTEPRERVQSNDLLRKTNTKPSQKETLHVSSSTGGEKSQANSTNGETAGNTPVEEITTSAKRTPLQQKQPTAPETARTRSESIDRINPDIVPRLVKRSEVTSGAVSRPRSNEPELPPTPVQLGLHAPPDRPRGLSSSSPGGSKSGSGRRRTRAMDDHNATSSPLKPKAAQSTMRDLDSQLDLPEEAPESQAPLSDSEAQGLPEEIAEKMKLLNSLKNELKTLKAQMTKVEEFLNANDLLEDTKGNTTLIELVKTCNPPAFSQSHDFEQEPTMKDCETPYRDLFAPGNLQLRTKTATKMTKGHAKAIHFISVTSPSPWPPLVYSANFEVVIDVENTRVEKVTWVDALKGHRQAAGIQAELHQWIQNRLSNELHRLDLGGLIWCLGTYFNASIERAKVFQALSRKYKSNLDDEEENAGEDGEENQSEGKTGFMTKGEAMSLLRYLRTSQVTFEVKTDQDSAMITRRTRKATPKIMAIWKLEPTWHGAIKSVCEIATSGVSASAQQPLIDVFGQVLRVGGFGKAFEAVWDMVVQSAGEGSRKKNDAEKMIAGGKKRKRFTREAADV